MKDLEQPQLVIEQAKRLHEALQPGAAGYIGSLKAENGAQQTAQVLAILPEDAARAQFAENIALTSGELATLWNDRGRPHLSARRWRRRSA